MFFIRTVCSDDIDSIVSLVNGAYRGEEAKKGWTTEADVLGGQRTDFAAIASTLNEPDSVILGAFTKEANELVGCVYLKNQKTSCYLGMLTVRPGLQNKGLGRQLMQSAEAQALEWNLCLMEIKVLSYRHELIAWYERQGFQKSSETHPFPYGNPRFGVPLVEDLEFFVFRKKLGN